MNLIVVSPQKSLSHELAIVTSLFENGLETFHLRKPHISTKKMKEYIEKIPDIYHNRIVIHSHHNLALKFNLKGIHLTSSHRRKRFKTWWLLRKMKSRKLTVSTSFHKLVSLDHFQDKYDYVFLSPIFDSITKKIIKVDSIYTISLELWKERSTVFMR